MWKHTAVHKRTGTGVAPCIEYPDEFTFEVQPQIAEEVKLILENSIADAGEYFKLNLPQIGEGEIGKDWSAIH